MPTTDRPMRADAQRSRQALLTAAGRLFAERGSAVQVDEIAGAAGLGMGTLYRHFATKQALLDAIVAQRFEAMAQRAQRADALADPADAFRDLFSSYLEAAAGDAAFRYAILGPEPINWSAVGEAKAHLREVATHIIDRAVTAGVIRDDLTFTDFVHITRGAMANMTGTDEHWRRHLSLVLKGVERS